MSYLGRNQNTRADHSGPRVDVEYEMETEPLSREMLKNW